MQYRKYDDKGIREIFLFERINSQDEKTFLHLMESFSSSKLHTIILNFNDTIWIDSMGLGLLLTAKKNIHDCKKTLILRNPKNHVRRSFYLMNFEHIFTIEEID